MKDAVRDLHFKNKLLQENVVKNKETFPYDIERLKEEVLELKKKNNYQEALIKILKVQINKLAFV